MMQKVKIFDSERELEAVAGVGKIHSCTVEGKPIAITKTKSGYFAFRDQCPHNRVPLSDGKCNIYDEIVCPWHNYRFDLKTGKESAGRDLNLKTYHLDISDEGVYLTL